MGKEKRKENQEEKVSEGRSPGVPLPTEQESEKEEEIWLSFWQDAVQELRSREFQSYEEALEAVVSEVVDRMPLSEEDASETAGFIKSLFDLDPILQEEVRSVFKIKG